MWARWNIYHGNGFIVCLWNSPLIYCLNTFGEELNCKFFFQLSFIILPLVIFRRVGVVAKPSLGGVWGVCLLETFCFHCRLHDGDGLVGWRDITHSPVSGAKGENRMSRPFFLFAHRGCAQSLSDLLLANKSSKINRNVYSACTQRHRRHTWSCSERLQQQTERSGCLIKPS